MEFEISAVEFLFAEPCVNRSSPNLNIILDNSHEDLKVYLKGLGHGCFTDIFPGKIVLLFFSNTNGRVLPKIQKAFFLKQKLTALDE